MAIPFAQFLIATSNCIHAYGAYAALLKEASLAAHKNVDKLNDEHAVSRSISESAIPTRLEDAWTAFLRQAVDLPIERFQVRELCGVRAHELPLTLNLPLAFRNTALKMQDRWPDLVTSPRITDFYQIKAIYVAVRGHYTYLDDESQQQLQELQGMYKEVQEEVERYQAFDAI